MADNPVSKLDGYPILRIEDLFANLKILVKHTSVVN